MTAFKDWLPLNPASFVVVLAALTVSASLLENAARRRRKRLLRQLAASWQMTYSPADRLRVLPKIADRFPIPGAADLHISHVIYGARGDEYRFVFTVEFTLGAVRGKRRMVRVATCAEPRTRDCAEIVGTIDLAPEGLSVMEQYEKFSPLVNPRASKPS